MLVCTIQVSSTVGVLWYEYAYGDCVLRGEAALDEESDEAAVPRDDLSQWLLGLLVAVSALVFLCCGSSAKAGDGHMDLAL